MADLRSVIAGNIRAQRARLQLTQADIGAVLHLGQSAVSALELGQRDVTVPELLSMCRLMNVKLEAFFRDADPADLEVLGL